MKEKRAAHRPTAELVSGRPVGKRRLARQDEAGRLGTGSEGARNAPEHTQPKVRGKDGPAGDRHLQHWAGLKMDTFLAPKFKDPAAVARELKLAGQLVPKSSKLKPK